MIRRLRDWGTVFATLPAASVLSGAGNAAEHGMPQLNSPDFAPQLIWLAIWFVVLYLLMAKLALPRVAATMEERRQRREGDLARAAQLKSEAEAANAAYRRTLAEARVQAQSTKEQALAEVRGIAVDVGRSVVEKLTGAAPDAAKMAAAVDSSLSGRAP